MSKGLRYRNTSRVGQPILPVIEEDYAETIMINPLHSNTQTQTFTLASFLMQNFWYVYMYPLIVSPATAPTLPHSLVMPVRRPHKLHTVH